MVYVLSEQITTRVIYSFKLIFETILNDKVEFIDAPETFEQADGIKINYSNNDNIYGFQIKPSGLLFDEHVQIQYPKIFEWEGEPAFFETGGSFIPFDLFAAAFYLAVRYEEYLPSKRDHHQRYQVRNSLAAMKGFLEKPLINIWALKLAVMIEKETPGFQFQRSRFSYQPTFDVDNAWAFKHKGFIRSFVSATRDLFHGRLKQFQHRWAVWMHLSDDPYDNYQFILETFRGTAYQPIFFFLLNNMGKHDRGLSPFNPHFRKLIRQISKQVRVGIHPSYASHKNKRQLKTEFRLLKLITGKEVTISRQHYLRLSFPETYRALLQSGIKEDYTMGYASRPGFRASICTPYPFFDLLENEVTPLIIHPFQVMDVTLCDYRDLRAFEAIQKIRKLMEECAAVGGTFVSIWHNESLGEEGRWKEWRKVCTSMVDIAKNIDNKTVK